MRVTLDNKDEFTKLVLEGSTIPELMEIYQCSRGAIATAKRRFNLVGRTPNSQRVNTIEGTKHCFKCNTTKPLDSFYSNGKTPNGTIKYKPSCKSCEGSSRRTKFINQIMELLSTLGIEYSCKDCGCTGEYGLLDFHHRDPKLKEFSIGLLSNSTYSKSTFSEILSEEILKCDILCPTCHRRRHLLTRT